MSSTPRTELDLNALRAPFARWFGAEVAGLERVGGGRNSQVYKVTAIGARTPRPRVPSAEKHADEASALPRCFALKAYFRHAADQRDRLATEYGSFSYLWANGFRQIPQPLVCDPALGWAIYQFIEGERIPPGQAGEAEVLAAVDFLGGLRELSLKAESRRLGVASEANFAVGLVADHVRQRLRRLEERRVQNAECRVDPALDEALRAFLAEELGPLLEEVVRWSESRLAAVGQSFTGELSWEQRTLSPSDFGFHNALRQPGNRIIFLDFEYFGWDDPAKMIADFLLHPAMDLSAALKKTFVSAIFKRFAGWPGLPGRVESVYPLFGLKWCLIFLNEFLPEALLRRQFAALAPADHAALQRQQLEKARRMLQQIRREYRAFPYRES